LEKCTVIWIARTFQMRFFVILYPSLVLMFITNTNLLLAELIKMQILQCIR